MVLLQPPTTTMMANRLSACISRLSCLNITGGKHAFKRIGNFHEIPVEASFAASIAQQQRRTMMAKVNEHVTVPLRAKVISIPSQEDKPFLHHGNRPRFRDPNHVKFKSPRKRASKLLAELNSERILAYKTKKPKVWKVPFRVGDAIEIQQVVDGGVRATTTEKIRGVVLGRCRRGLDETVLLQDSLHGEMVQYRVPLHSPLVRSIRIIESNFVFKGKRKVKRAKLYYLAERNPAETRVTKW